MRWNLVDRIDTLVVGEHAAGVVAFDPALPLFEDHFPRFPVVPGVLILESLAQLSGKLIGLSVKRERGTWPFPILTMADKVKFRRFVPPGVEVVLETRLIAIREDMAAVKVRAKVGKKVHAQAEQIFAFSAVPLDTVEEQQAVESIEWAALRALWVDCPDDLR